MICVAVTLRLLASYSVLFTGKFPSATLCNDAASCKSPPGGKRPWYLFSYLLCANRVRVKHQGHCFWDYLIPLQLKFFSDLLLVKLLPMLYSERRKRSKRPQPKREEDKEFRVCYEVLCESLCTQKNPVSGKNAVNQESQALLFIFVGSGAQS